MLDDLRFRLRALLRRDAVEQELDDELRFHLDREVEKHIRSGVSEQEARRLARLAFGGHEQVKENCREARGTGWIELWLQDARYALRQLWANPAFALTIILTLALSIGANSAIFSVIDGVLIRKLPYPHPERLVRLFLSNATYPRFPLNLFDFRDFRARNRSFESMAAFTRGDVQLSGSGEPVHLTGFGITSGYFRVLGLRPELGREFDYRAEIPGNGLQVILSDRLWRTRFGADPKIIGRKITLNMQPFTVIGVMPAGTEHPGNEYHAVAFGHSVDVWWPFSFGGDPNRRGSHYVEGIGRLRPGVSIESARAEMNAIMTELGREHPDFDSGWTVLVVPLYTEVVGADRQLLLVLLGAVGMVLLIACANIANLLLAKAAARQREIAVRMAMGAPRFRVVRQLLTESLLIAFMGGALGLAVAVGGVKVLVSLLPTNFPRAADIHVNGEVFAFTLAVSLVTGILFGLAPALQASRTDPKQGLQQGGRTSTSSRSQGRLRNALIIAEVSLACVLLIAAGLMLRSFLNLAELNPGFRRQHVLTASISLPNQQYGSVQTEQFCDRLVSGLNALPGVESAGVGSDLPWTGYDENLDGFAIEGKKPATKEGFHARFHSASPGYFRALRIPLVEGRFFTEADKGGAPLVLIVNHAMAERYWPGEDVIGKRISFEDAQKKDSDWTTIVGVAGDVKDQPNSLGAEPAFWWPESQALWIRNMSIVIRARSNPESLVDAMRGEVHRIDPNLAVSDVRLMDNIVDHSLSTPRFTFVLVGLFAGLAVLLAAMGAYGVIAYTVGQRTQEFGVRLALGAERADLVRLVLRQGAALVAPGAAIGVLLALGLDRALRTLLYGVSLNDPSIFASAALLVLAVGLAASYFPARRAAQADPMTTLRAE